MSGLLAIAVLAAGSARRFGGGKLDADCAGKPLGRWALEAARSLGPDALAVVVGDEALRFAEGAELVRNPYAGKGLGTSVAAAARWAIERKADALLIMLADMPLVTGGMLRELAEGPLPAAAIHPGGKPGAPACFPAGQLSAVQALQGDGGAGALLRDHDGVRLVACDAAELRDVDRPEDLAEVERVLRGPLSKLR